MTMDRTLRGRTGLGGNRSVLKRDERIAKMTDEGKFEMEAGNPMGLPKLKIRHSKAGAKAKKEEKAAVEGAAAPAEGAAAPAAGKAAAPAAGAKAAPAAKAPAKGKKE